MDALDNEEVGDELDETLDVLLRDDNSAELFIPNLLSFSMKALE